MWSGAARSTPINDKTDRKKPSAWRKGTRKTRRSVNAVSIAQSENVFGAPGRPDGDGRHASVASAESHSVTSPRWTTACSYADQFPTRYFVLYFGWTFDLMSRSCTRSGHRGQRAYSCLVAAEGCRVAPGDCSPEALTRTGLGGFHHPALPLMWLMAMRPRFARESEARAEDIVPTTQRTSARGPTTFRMSGDMSPRRQRAGHGSLRTRTPTRAAFARPGPGANPFPDVLARMQPSDSRPPVGRGSGRPWPVAYPVPRATRRKKGLPRCLGRPLPACRRLRPRWGRVSACPSRPRPPSPSGCTMPWAPRMSVISWL